jgi:hypothetical protein
MQNWKKMVIFGSLGAGAALAFSGRRSAGVAVMAGGLALLASEYPEKFEAVWESAPEYVSRATRIFAALQQISERFAEEAERRSLRVVQEYEPDYGA